jgi:hypothetical protein
MKSVTRWFVLPRFGSCKPTPRWGGHKDRVSFNPFPLSNGHLDRVSFSPQSIGTLSPHKDHHTNWFLLLWFQRRWQQEMGKKKSDPSARAQRTRPNLSLLVTNCFDWNWDLERLWFNLIVSCIECTSSCIECIGWKLGCLEVWWLGGIYSPNHQSGHWEGLLSMGAPNSPVVHRTVTMHCPVRLLRLLWLCACCPRTVAFTVHFCRRPLVL